MEIGYFLTDAVTLFSGSAFYEYSGDREDAGLPPLSPPPLGFSFQELIIGIVFHFLFSTSGSLLTFNLFDSASSGSR